MGAATGGEEEVGGILSDLGRRAKGGRATL